MTRFTYFGYASNLTHYKIGLRCKTVKLEGIGRLENFTMEFQGDSTNWIGGSATLVPKKGETVWGAIWSIAESERAILDEQEGVMTGMYKASSVDVVDATGISISCRVYEQVQRHDRENCPSPQYLAVIVEGAEARRLPPEYIAKLKGTKTNGNTIITNMMREVHERRREMGFSGDIF